MGSVQSRKLRSATFLVTRVTEREAAVAGRAKLYWITLVRTLTRLLLDLPEVWIP